MGWLNTLGQSVKVKGWFNTLGLSVKVEGCPTLFALRFEYTVGLSLINIFLHVRYE